LGGLNIQGTRMSDAPIKYISGGLLGDFINQLSIIQETYKKTGRKGFLFVSDLGEKFRFGLQKVYDDTKEFIKAQEYIYEYKMYRGEVYDINLSEWRNSPHLYHENWVTIFESTYKVPWGKHKWLSWKTDPFFSDKILVSYSTRRENRTINYTELFKKFPADKLLFVTMDMKEYVFFSNLSGTAIRLKFCDTLEELLTVINSCKLFIGNFSAPLQFAFACNKPTMGILMPGLLDNIHMMNFPSYIKHYQSIM
jgi:hypothetical protein